MNVQSAEAELKNSNWSQKLKDFKSVVKELGQINESRKALDRKLKALKPQFIEFADADEVPNYALETTSIFIPKEFWSATGISLEAFIETRYPTWELMHTENKDDGDILILQKRKEFLNRTYNEDGYTVSKVIVEGTTEIDWDTLQRERPDLFDKLARPRLVIELDENEFARMVNEDPEFISILDRHRIVKSPQKRVNTDVIKDGHKEE